MCQVSATALAWLSEPLYIKSRPNEGQRILFFDKYSGHAVDEESESLLLKNRTILKLLPPNTAHLVQSADSFIILKMKEPCRKRW